MSVHQTAPEPSARAALALFTHEEARVIWARAAQLQAEADDAERRATVVGTIAPATAPAALTVMAPAGMYFGRELVSAAQAAGIHPAHLAVALAEHEAAAHETWLEPNEAQRARFVRELGSDAGSVRAVAFIPGTRDTVMAQLRDAFGRAPWNLTFEGSVGVASAAGEVLRFRVPPWLVETSEGKLDKSLATNGFVYNANRIGVQTLHVLLEAQGTPDQPAYEVTVTGDLRLGQHLNTDFIRMFRVLMPVLFGVTGGVLSGFDGGVASLLSGMTALGAAAGATAGVLFTAMLRRLMRWEHRTAMRVLERGMNSMLRAIGRPVLPDHARGERAQPAEPPSLD
ncbi:MAG: hypothetical protein MUD17_11825 [Gemmatimonadaceae bacterium]|nr:hypothetical protein [Gemmatimonadaceae bacterium]